LLWTIFHHTIPSITILTLSGQIEKFLENLTFREV